MRLRTYLILAGVAVLLVSFGAAFSEAEAGPGAAVEAMPVAAPPFQIDNDSCLFCHSEEGFNVTLANGDILPLTIDPNLFAESVHGSNGLTCVTCHTDIKTVPHSDRTVESRRDVKLKYYTSCKQCHEEQFNLTLDSVHQKALAAGNENAAVCADCHNPHTQQRLTNKESGRLLDYARLHIPETCAQCHSAIYDEYKQSVHGKALTQEGNLDVPTCIDCHGVHNIQSPNTTTFRNSTPFLCAQCHTNNALMFKYGLSTQVLNTYVADFHGTTVVAFDRSFPDQPTDKPVCTDCHGVHDIVRADDPNKGLSTRENLLKRCQQCHPNATANFPDSWMSHYIPSAEKYPIVYYVNLFYKFFIPAVLGPMIILVVMDFGRMMINRFKRPKPVVATEGEPPAEGTVAAEETQAPEDQPKPESVQEEPAQEQSVESVAPPEEAAAQAGSKAGAVEEITVTAPEAVAPAEVAEKPAADPGTADQPEAESDAAQEPKSTDGEETSR